MIDVDLKQDVTCFTMFMQVSVNEDVVSSASCRVFCMVCEHVNQLSVVFLKSSTYLSVCVAGLEFMSCQLWAFPPTKLVVFMGLDVHYLKLKCSFIWREVWMEIVCRKMSSDASIGFLLKHTGSLYCLSP
jgi:hypothetical protein